MRSGNLDFTNPRTVDWWQTMLTHAVRDQAWDGWMEDFGEYVDDSDQLAAGDGTRLSEVYPLLYHKITTRIVQALNPNIVSFARSGFVGTQQFPMLWGGDQSHDWKRDTRSTLRHYRRNHRGHVRLFHLGTRHHQRRLR